MRWSRLPPFLQERYRQDLTFRIWVDYCFDRGIPFDYFLGGKDEWNDYSRDIVTMRVMESFETCPSCGTRSSEWDPKQGGDLHAYYPESYLCHGCKAIEAMHHANWENAKEGGGRTDGVKVRLKPKHVVEREQYEEQMRRVMGNL